ncbi:RNA polymerase sigma factor [Arenimonas terrae]|uniref:Sigma-70 family RNA polymerase sigma factor n=1 Tax=Arenimonas terrae TaxID=2546226 RepID=A0A5C4RP55_9GAMM|nr:sigma-70 family RNA polymerase sigma factor [Arenimonas terrae]TNJ32902.1 sigma-70 family RNA polymerase sigma factor [Arenimonas terrae]
MSDASTRQAIEAVFRIERSKLIAGLARMLRDLDAAEELAQDAFLAAFTDWPVTGIPDNPGAWLMTTAKRRAIDAIRRRQLHADKEAFLVDEAEQAKPFASIEDIEAAMDHDIGDHRLGLIFTACHPVLGADARAALTLRLLGGLDTGEIGRAFLTSEATIAQRIVRAKRSIGEAGVAFEVPRGRELAPRLASVLEVIYLIFNEGYAATAGDDRMRPALCQEAQRLGRVLAARLPDEPEVFGLLALMELQASRLVARTAADGSLLTLAQQNRARWDQLLVHRGLAALNRSEALGGERGPYALQARIAAHHARAKIYEATDWPGIASTYDTLAEVMPSPVIELNRAVAHSMAYGPEAGLRLLDAIAETPALQTYAPLPAARGDFLFRAGRVLEAKLQFARAAELAQNAREREFLRKRSEACG